MYLPRKLIFLFPTGYSVAAGEFSGDGVEGKSTNQTLPALGEVDK